MAILSDAQPANSVLVYTVWVRHKDGRDIVPHCVSGWTRDDVNRRLGELTFALAKDGQYVITSIEDR